MRKTVLTLIAVLIAVYVVFSLIGSNKEYMAEKFLYRASKTYDKIKLNPDATPTLMLASLERDLQKVVEKYPESSAATLAYITLAETYLANKKYDEAISATEDIIKRYEDNIGMLSKASFIKALAYEQKGEWDKALTELTKLRDKYTNTPIGLQVPLYIATRYRIKGNTEKAEEAFNEAISFYTDLKEKNRGTMMGYSSANMLVQTYMGLGRPEEAGEVVEGIITEYPAVTTMLQQVPYVDLIYVKTLKKPERAINIYKSLKEKMPDEKIKKFLETRIAELEKRKK